MWDIKYEYIFSGWYSCQQYLEKLKLDYISPKIPVQLCVLGIPIKLN